MSDMNMVLGRARYAGGTIGLVLGFQDAPPAPDPVTAHGTTVLAGVSGAGLVLYANRNPLRVSAGTSQPLQRATAAALALAMDNRPPTRLLGGHAQPLQQASAAEGVTRQPLGVHGRLFSDRGQVHQQATASAAAPAQPHQATARLRAQAAQVHQAALALQVIAAQVHQAATLTHTSAALRVQQATAMRAVAAQIGGAARFISFGHVQPFQAARRVPPGKEVWPPVPGGPGVEPYVPDLNLVLACPPYEQGAPIGLVIGRVCLPPVSGVVVIPVRSYYVVQNNVSLHRVPSGDEFVASRFNLQIDADSFTFSWSASLHISARAHLGRSAPGERIDVECAVNGVLLRLVVEKIGRDRSFPEHRIAVSGRGRAAELADTDLTFTNPADRTAQQLMADVLTVNGASLGWALDWQITDWFIPADRWVFRGSYSGALQDIASAAGAYIQPHLTAKTLRVLPRYPHAPWDWATLLPVDIELPVEATTVVGFEEVIRPDHNRVFVGGVLAPGIFGPVTRAGTAGDKVALPIVHPLITAAEAHIQRGRAELSNTGVQEIVSVRTLVLPETGIILPGKALRFVDEDGPRLGLVRGTNVSMDNWPVMHQTLEVETHAQ